VSVFTTDGAVPIMSPWRRTPSPSSGNVLQQSFNATKLDIVGPNEGHSHATRATRGRNRPFTTLEKNNIATENNWYKVPHQPPIPEISSPFVR